MTVTRFFLIRHGVVEATAREVLYGTMDVALCQHALTETAAAYRWLALRLPRAARWFVTNLSRTRATAAAIFAAGYPAREVGTEPDFAEQHLGHWQGLPHQALPPLLRDPPHPFWPHGAEEKPPHGESFREVQARVAAALERLATLCAGEDVVIVAHGGSIRAALAHALQLTPAQALSFSIRNLSLTRLEKHGPVWRVAAVNEEGWEGCETPPATAARAGEG